MKLRLSIPACAGRLGARILLKYLFHDVLGGAVQVAGMAGFVCGYSQHMLDPGLARRHADVHGAIDVIVQRIHGVVFSNRDNFRRSQVQTNIMPNHGEFQRLKVTNVTLDILDVRVESPHRCVMVLTTRINRKAASPTLLLPPSGNCPAQGPRSAGYKQVRLSDIHASSSLPFGVIIETMRKGGSVPVQLSGPDNLSHSLHYNSKMYYKDREGVSALPVL